MALGPKVNVIINTIYLPKYGKVGEDRCVIEIYNGCTVAELIDMARCQVLDFLKFFRIFLIPKFVKNLH